MKVVVKLRDETQMVLRVESSDTVFSVKERIPNSEVLLQMEERILSSVNSTRYPTLKLEIGTKLFFEGQELEDFRILADYGIADNDTLHLHTSFSCAPVPDIEFKSNVLYNYFGEPEIITVFVVLPNGRRLAPEVDRTQPASKVFTTIPERELIPIVQQIVKPMIREMKTNATIELKFIKKLSFQGQIISKGDALTKYNIKNDDVLHLNVDVSFEVIESAKVNRPTDSPKLTTSSVANLTDRPIKYFLTSPAANLPKPTSTESAKVNYPTFHLKPKTLGGTNLPIPTSSKSYQTDDKATANLPKPAATSIKRNGEKVNHPIDDKATANLPKSGATSIKCNGLSKCAVM